jgi:ATP-dependent exoDNAse (exonuclease V) beta subunit
VSGDLKVVDFKTNKPEFNETNFAFEERMRRTYQPQLQIYVDIIAEIEQVQPKACLFLTYTQRFLDFDFTTRTGTR